MSIAIVGLGILCAIGNDKAQVLESLRQQRTGIGEMRYLRSTHHELPVGEVKCTNEELKTLLGIDPRKEVSRTALLGMAATRQALDDAGIPYAAEAGGIQKPSEQHAGPRTIFVNGTTVGGMDITEQHFGELRAHPNGPLAEDTLDCLHHHDCGSSTEDITRHFGCFEDCATISTACSSAANAIILGAQLLEAGEADRVVVGGTEALSVFHLNGFNSLMILDHEPCRPFDKDRAGLNLGEGAAYLVLERGEEVTAGQTVYGYLQGWGNACDAYHQTASSPDGEGATRAMHQALERAQLQPTDIDYVNAHGTGTPDNDRSESAALRRVFGDMLPPVSSTKSFTGHTTSASGSIEAVICLLALRHHFLPANLGWKAGAADLITPTTGADDVTLRHILSNAFAFGGNDSALVFGSEPVDHAQIQQGAAPKVLSRVEITEKAELSRLKEYVKPMEMRRMSKIIKSALLSSLDALKAAEVDCPNAIITATAWGCMENSEKLLDELEDNGEEALKPTLFMQSTHNTISSAMAIRLKDHGYNVTICQKEDSMRWALKQARLLLDSGCVHTVLVGCHDETTPLFTALRRQAGMASDDHEVHSVAMVLSNA